MPVLRVGSRAVVNPVKAIIRAEQGMGPSWEGPLLVREAVGGFVVYGGTNFAVFRATVPGRVFPGPGYYRVIDVERGRRLLLEPVTEKPDIDYEYYFNAFSRIYLDGFRVPFSAKTLPADTVLVIAWEGGGIRYGIGDKYLDAALTRRTRPPVEVSGEKLCCRVDSGFLRSLSSGCGFEATASVVRSRDGRPVPGPMYFHGTCGNGSYEMLSAYRCSEQACPREDIDINYIADCSSAPGCIDLDALLTYVKRVRKVAPIDSIELYNGYAVIETYPVYVVAPISGAWEGFACRLSPVYLNLLRGLAETLRVSRIRVPGRGEKIGNIIECGEPGFAAEIVSRYEAALRQRDSAEPYHPLNEWVDKLVSVLPGPARLVGDVVLGNGWGLVVNIAF